MAEWILPLTIWHWLALALVLFFIEMALGTFDLLMVAIGAVATALWAGFAPQELGGWEIQLVVFFIAALLLIVLGRTVFASMRTGGPGMAGLNKRMDRLEGAHGIVVREIAGGQGRVKIGDSEWLAESADGTPIPIEASVVVVGAKSTVVQVRPA